MKSFLARGDRWVAVFSAADAVEATRVLLALFSKAGVAVEEMDVLEFFPDVEGGVLLGLDGVEVARTDGGQG